MVDATWTVRDLLALVAGDAKVLCSQLVAQQDGVLAHPTEFVLARSGTSFQVSISPALMPLPALPVQMCNMPQLPFPPICSDASKPAGEAHIRLAIRHPVWTTVRTCAVRDDTHLSVAIRLLLPDIAATMDILPVVNGFVCNPELPVALALRATCELTFQSHKPYPRAAIIAIPCVGNPAPDKDTTLVKRWVRSPFQSKASEMSFQQGTTLMEIGAASYLKCTSNQSFLTMEDGRHIDPRTRVECTQPEKVLDFRACPVKGGAKQPPKNDDIRKVVTKALADRGVPQPALPARVACVLSNIDPAHLRTHLHEPSHDFWSSLKKLASDAKIRLITPTVLKEWQQTLRKRKQSEGLSQGSSSSHANSIRAIDVATITIDLQSFKAEGSKVSYLAPERFGPDQEGLAIMTKAAAEAFLPASRISAGPLAIAIVDTKPIAGLQQFMAPAFNHQDQPVLVPTCLVNFGDVEIKFAADVPSTSMGAVASCVVEFWVRRDLAAQWKDVADHMQYLGVHLPELRNGKVMATWSAKFFSKDRKPAPHDKAAYPTPDDRC